VTETVNTTLLAGDGKDIHSNL